MRTLKKTLSLLLAVALVLSLTVVGASAAYTGNKVDTLKDAADVGADYSEAVGVMVGLGIIEGYDDGTLRPETTYTREQAAKIIAYMQLGPKDADSLRCTKAPFTDVAADRWSAGYIAYCVEQGIIDGMGDGTFQPEAQLTGYQWAKMLLCAVGYGRNDEYVGSSWSLNTAKDALDKGIFDGDLDGADHVVLTRQQAILYAFNTLTSVGVVVYSPSLGDYILAYGNFADRATIEGTLGAKVYGLASVTGIIVDNEAMGYSKTRISVQNKYKVDKTTTGEKADVEVAANTGLDMMYHAVKVWHTNGTAVYVIDKAAVTTLTCLAANNETAVKKLGKVSATLTIGDKEDATSDNGGVYEYHYVNNGSAGTVGVEYYYGLGQLGVRSESNKTTVLYEGNERANGTRGTVMENAEIKTDISEIDNRDAVVYINPTSNTDTTKEAWHVSAVAYTTIRVSDWSRTKGTITAEDGTVYNASTFFDGNWADMDQGTTVTLSLDTHGDFIDFNATSARVVGYYTGTTRPSSAHDAWFADAALVAQFVNIETGEPMEVPVTTAWAAVADGNNQNYGNLWRSARGYYDITDPLLGTGNYAPTEVDQNDNVYNATNVFVTGSIVVDADSYKFSAPTATGFDGNVYYDNDDVVIHLVDSWGANLEVEHFTGVDAMLDAYDARSMVMRNLAVTGYFDAQGTFYATTIFAFAGQMAVNQMVFLPDNITVFDTVTHVNGNQTTTQVQSFDNAYLNGEALKSRIKLDPTGMGRLTQLSKGFYWYTVLDGLYTLIPATPYVDFVYDQVTVRRSPNGTVYFDPDQTIFGWDNEMPVLADAKIVDLRTIDPDDKIDTVDELADFYFGNYVDYDEIRLQVAYTWNEDGQIDVIYVVDQAYGRITVHTNAAVEQEIGSFNPGRVFEDAANVILNAKKEGVVGTEVTVTFYVDENSSDLKTVPGKIIDDGDNDTMSNLISVDFTRFVNDGDYEHDVTITDTKVVVKLNNKLGDFDMYVKVNTGTPELKADNAEIELEIGDTVAFSFIREDAKNLTAAYTLMNGTTPVTGTSKFGNTGADFWTSTFVPLNDVSVESITAKIQLDLADDDDAAWSLGNTVADVNVGEVFEIEAGDAFTVVVRHSDADGILTDTNDHFVAKFTIGGTADFTTSESREQASGANGVFNIKDVTGFTTVSLDEDVNVISVDYQDWVADPTVSA